DMLSLRCEGLGGGKHSLARFLVACFGFRVGRVAPLVFVLRSAKDHRFEELRRTTEAVVEGEKDCRDDDAIVFITPKPFCEVDWESFDGNDFVLLIELVVLNAAHRSLLLSAKVRG